MRSIFWTLNAPPAHRTFVFRHSAFMWPSCEPICIHISARPFTWIIYSLFHFSRRHFTTFRICTEILRLDFTRRGKIYLQLMLCYFEMPKFIVVKHNEQSELSLAYKGAFGLKWHFGKTGMEDKEKSDLTFPNAFHNKPPLWLKKTAVCFTNLSFKRIDITESSMKLESSPWLFFQCLKRRTDVTPPP